MIQPHLDDEQLSADLDGLALDERERSHLQGCADCAARLRALAAASMAVAAPVVPLGPAVVETLVATATASQTGPGAGAGGEGEGIVSLDGPRRSIHRPATPARTWMTGAAAALVLLAGLSAFLQTNARDDSNTALGGAQSRSVPAASDEADTSMTATFDPAVVAADIGDLDDPARLAVVLSASLHSGSGASRDAVQEDATSTPPNGATGEPAPPLEPTASPRQSQKAAPAGAGQERALCVNAAREIGAGRLGSHLSTRTLRWKGRAAEVLVFLITEPAEGVSLQALVLSRPGCDLLADPRF